MLPVPLLLALAASTLRGGAAQNLTDGQIEQVKARLAEGAQQPWELGTRAQALVELDAPFFSVLTPHATLPPSRTAPSNISDVLAIAKGVVSNRTTANGNVQGPQPFMKDSSAADPASNGFAVILANWTNQGGEDYAGAARDQIDFLFSGSVPKTSDGAISHRTDQLQLWSDFVYMVPPFLAYYGMVTQNKSMVQEGYNQIKLYRKYLRDTKANNLWQHIALGQPNGAVPNDAGHWSTGNGWAAAGMLRVLGTIQNSQFSSSLKSESSDLKSWVSEIHGGMYAHQPSSGLFPNYADNSSTFSDASSTALLASTVYRLALLGGSHTHLPNAENARKALSANATSGGAQHFDQDGWLTPVVNPYSFGSEGSKSPEGQAFVLEMQSAWRDWVAAGSPGANAAGRTAVLNAGLVVGALVIGATAVLI